MPFRVTKHRRPKTSKQPQKFLHGYYGLVEGWKPAYGKRHPTDLSKIHPSGEELSTAANELVLYADNDSRIYQASFIPIVKNLKRKVLAGTFDFHKSVIAFKHHADFSAKQYHREHGSLTQSWHEMFDTSDRLQAARHWAKRFVETRGDL